MQEEFQEEESRRLDTDFDTVTEIFYLFKVYFQKNQKCFILLAIFEIYENKMKISKNFQ